MDQNPSLQEIAEQLYAFLASRFPVCCFSDEFYYFPQALNPEKDWSSWDDFSPDAVQDTVSYIKGLRLSLESCELTADTPGERYSRNLLLWHLQVLTEQLEDVRLHATRPTFLLTVATAGILEAFQGQGISALEARLSSLPKFMQRAAEALSPLPGIFAEPGLKMCRDLSRWIGKLEDEINPVDSSLKQRAIDSVDLFARKLSHNLVKDEFRMETGLLERIVEYHSGSGMTLDHALAELADEEQLLGSLMKREGRKLSDTRDLNLLFEELPVITFPGGGARELLANETARLRKYCRDVGIYAAIDSPEIHVEPVPASLQSVRSADSYSALPGSPFRGGIFYVYQGGSLGSRSGSAHPSYRMTVAHETFPGHHLLDTCRWNHPDPVRRPLEYPLFYEGWACYGEELMHHLGAMDMPWDPFLLYWRRRRHAVRGKADLMLHSGRLDLDGAAQLLVGAGFGKARAAETVRKYALQPAYQMCYTVGRLKFQNLFHLAGRERIPDFMNNILSEGELLFQDLEQIIQLK